MHKISKKDRRRLRALGKLPKPKDRVQHARRIQSILERPEPVRGAPGR